MDITNAHVTAIAKELGFDLAGFAKAETLERETAYLEKWLADGRHSGMAYMEKNLRRRRDVKEILPDAKSVISLGLNYYQPDSYTGDTDSGKVSRYAWGKDYHLIIWEKLDKFSEELKKLDAAVEVASYVDTGPVMDKVWARRAGLGWIGKHTNLITKEIGSWIFLATVIINRDFDYGREITDHCGACTRCLDACPTGALTNPYEIDAGKCISYLTIENKGEIDPSFKGKFENYIFGCDICQDVCPWNHKFGLETKEPDFTPINKEIKFADIERMENGEFKEKFKESPILRAKLKGMRRNAGFLKGGYDNEIFI